MVRCPWSAARRARPVERDPLRAARRARPIERGPSSAAGRPTEDRAGRLRPRGVPPGAAWCRLVPPRAASVATWSPMPAGRVRVGRVRVGRVPVGRVRSGAGRSVARRSASCGRDRRDGRLSRAAATPRGLGRPPCRRTARGRPGAGCWSSRHRTTATPNVAVTSIRCPSSSTRSPYTAGKPVPRPPWRRAPPSRGAAGGTPRRPSAPPGRASSRSSMHVATETSTWSPAWCPCRSLISLKRSRSHSTMAKVRPERL